MATKNKTTATSNSVAEFINSLADSDQKKQDSFRLLELMEKWSGCKPKMWGPSIIGFGSYHYKYASGHEGDSMLIGFSPRKAEFSLYVVAPGTEQSTLLAQLGKHKMGKACIYFKKLSDLRLDILEQLCKATLQYLNDHYDCSGNA